MDISVCEIKDKISRQVNISISGRIKKRQFNRYLKQMGALSVVLGKK